MTVQCAEVCGVKVQPRDNATSGLARLGITLSLLPPLTLLCGFTTIHPGRKYGEYTMESQLSQSSCGAQVGDCIRGNAPRTSTAPDDAGLQPQGDNAGSSDSETSNINIERISATPYAVGSTLIATRHKPHEPFGIGYSTGGPPMLENWKTLSQRELCCTRLPLGGQTVCEDQITLTITNVIRIGFNKAAQLVVVNKTMIAKIFDPLYYRNYDEYGRVNVVYDADSDYSREAVAYEQLQKSTAAKEVTPAFYGTWTIHVNTLLPDGKQYKKYTRQVPLILMEYIHGETMPNIDVENLPEQTRSHLLKRILDVDIIIFHAGVDNSDYCPRNIMITGLPDHSAGDAPDGLAVKAIDFNVAIVRHHPRAHENQWKRKIDEEREAWLPKLLSPMVRWYSGIDEFSTYGWCPSGEGEAELWLLEQYWNDERYIPVNWDPSNPNDRPRLVELESDSETSVDSGLGMDMIVEKGEEGEEGDRGSGVELDDHSASAVQSL